MNNDWIENQRRRWMRNAAHLHVRHDAHRFAPPGSARLVNVRDARWDPLGVLERKYSPNQPRIPAGSPDGGQWTTVSAGGGISLALPMGRVVANQIAADADSQVIDRNDRRVRLAGEPPIFGPVTRVTIAIEAARVAIELFRETNLLNDLFGNKHGAVSYTELDGKALYGVNSDSNEYQDRDVIAAERLRADLVTKYPDVMKTVNIGQRPNDAVFHAEATVLLRASRQNGGSLAGRSLEVHVDKPMCTSCDKILPLVGLELGDPTVTFVGPSGLTKTMHHGIWNR